MNAIVANETSRPSAPAAPLADVVVRIQPLPTKVVGPAATDLRLDAEEDEWAEAALSAQRRRVFDSSYLPAAEDRFRIH